MKKKVLYITNLPAPYKVDYFNELGKYTDLTVIFERSKAKNRASAWSSSASSEGFKTVFLSGIDIGDEMSVDVSIIKYLMQNRDSLILLNGYSSPTEMLAILYMKAHHVAFGLVCDGLLIKEESAFVRWLKEILISSASFWLSSGRETDKVLTEHGADGSKIFRYPFSSVHEYDIASVPYNRKEVKDAVGCKSKYMILYVGQMIHRKGIDLLLEAVTGIDMDFQLYLIGDQIPFSNEKVVNIGFLDKYTLKKYYMASDLFVLPSREDIWGLVVNEAMGYGVPVIATDRCGAALEMVKNGKNGVIVPAGDVCALQEKIVSILKQQESTPFMLNAVDTAKNYTIEKMAECTWEIIRQL